MARGAQALFEPRPPSTRFQVQQEESTMSEGYKTAYAKKQDSEDMSVRRANMVDYLRKERERVDKAMDAHRLIALEAVKGQSELVAAVAANTKQIEALVARVCDMVQAVAEKLGEQVE